MPRLVLRLALTALLALSPLAASASASPSAGARLAATRADLGQASMRLAQARSLGDRAAEAEAAAAKARHVRDEARLISLAAAERATGLRRRAAERAERAEAAQAAASVTAPPPTTSAYAPYTSLAASAGPPPGAEALVPLLDGYLASRQSPLTGLAATFVSEGAAAGVDPRLLVAIAGAETSFGVYRPSQAIRNPFGLGPGMSFGSWEESIRYAARNLAGPIYAGEGRVTIPAIQARWAPNGAANDPTGLNSHWTRNVTSYHAELGGDPTSAVIGLARSAAADGPARAASIPRVAERPPSAAEETPARRLAVSPPPADEASRGTIAAAAALALEGSPYAMGGTDVRGIDGPGLVRAGWARAGVALPGSIAALAAAGTPLAPAAVRAGDAVLLRGARVGVYLGAGRFAWVPGPGAVVTVASFRDRATAALYVGARRLGGADVAG